MQINKNYTGYLNDFSIVNKSWGFERIFINTDLYCTKELVIFKNSSTSKHYHKNKHETFYIVEGIANITTYDLKGNVLNIFTLNERQSFCIEPQTVHSIENISFEKLLVVLESSTQDKKIDNIRI
jgi:mannose-6-phosphate isomerase-like protein (cupin superfamily)